MSLVKKPRMTEKRLAALKRSREHAHGPATRAGRERIRATHLRHGLYSQSDEAALRALGEDPADFQELLAGLRDQGIAGSTLYDRLAKRLARALLRVERADHMADGYALRQAKAEEGTRQGRLHMQMMRLKMVARSWQRLAQAVARPHYVTTEDDLEFMQKLHTEGVAKEMSEVALALFYQLREPGSPMPGDPDFTDREEYQKAQRVVAQVKQIFGIGRTPFQQPMTLAAPRVDAPSAEGQPDGAETESGDDENCVPPPGLPRLPAETYPQVTEEQWQAREPVRQLLENLLTRQVEIFEAQHRELLRESLAGPSIYERAAEIVPVLPNSALVQRLEDANCRQVLRLTNLLIRLGRFQRQMQRQTRRAVSSDVDENKGR